MSRAPLALLVAVTLSGAAANLGAAQNLSCVWLRHRIRSPRKPHAMRPRHAASSRIACEHACRSASATSGQRRRNGPAEPDAPATGDPGDRFGLGNRMLTMALSRNSGVRRGPRQTHPLPEV